MSPEMRAKLVAARAEQMSIRAEIARLDAELPVLVYRAFAEEGRTWQEIAEALGGRTKARVYQLRKLGEKAFRA